MRVHRFLALCPLLVGLLAQAVRAADRYAPPSSPRATYSFNADWKFERAAQPDADLPNFQAVDFSDAAWATVSTPHSFNDVDSFRKLIIHAKGDQGVYQGLAFYRKHFKVPPGAQDGRVFIEFEGMRQAGDIFLNGKEIGLSENGITAYGIDISTKLNYGDADNVLAVRIDNRTDYKEKATGTSFEWNVNHFNPDFGGLNRRVWLHVTGKIHQTLPIYDGLQTTGTYIHADNFSIANKTATISVESQVENASAAKAAVALSVVIVEADGAAQATFSGSPVTLEPGTKGDAAATAPCKNLHFWSPDDPYLYNVYTIASVEGKVVDVTKTVTGFRKVEFKGGAGKGGIYINEKFTYLKGFSQRSSDEWAGLGQGYPEWMHDLNTQIIRECHSNYIRWMHVSPQKVDVDAYDKAGIIEVCPAGDQEKDATGRQWDQRMEVMRDSIIYFRNSPSILFWEAGNNGISAAHMKQMVDLKAQLDPHGGRAMGCRSLTDPATTNIAEYFGTMLGQVGQRAADANPTTLFREFSQQRRDLAPFIETEDFRDEGARRFWDDFSPPYFGFKKGPGDTYNWNSETFALAGVTAYNNFWSNRISNTDPLHAKWSGYASIYFFDSNADGRQQSSETSRVSGKVDAVRLPKEIFYAHRVMQAETPDIHIIGHWTYPANTKKTMYVIANTPSVELFVNGKSLGVNSKPTDGFTFAFPNVTFAEGSIKAVGTTPGKPPVEHELTTAGPAAKITLTPIVGPSGLQADGEDVALFDVQVVDARGQRCPTDDARIDFTCAGTGIWRGGYNSGKLDSTNNLYCNTECGINRVSVRTTRTAGTITVTAKRTGLEGATVTVESKPVKVTSGLAER